MKYHKRSYIASKNVFFVMFSFSGNTVPTLPVVPEPTGHLDTHGGCVNMARESFLSLSLLSRYLMVPSGSKYGIHSLKDRKKITKNALKSSGRYTIRRFLRQTDPDFFPIDIQNKWIK
jgi:hypothetical protein